MRSTLRNESARASPRGRRFRIPLLSSRLLAVGVPARSLLPLAVVCIPGGCTSVGSLHPDFDRFRPRTVCVLPVENATVHRLDHVSFGGILQRALLGARTLDVLEILRGAAEESLILKGYRIGECPPGAASAGEDPTRAARSGADAVCRVTVTEWASDSVTGESLHVVYRIEIRHVESGAILFAARHGCGYRESDREPREDEIPYLIRRSVRTALGALPEVPEVPGLPEESLEAPDE